MKIKSCLRTATFDLFVAQLRQKSKLQKLSKIQQVKPSAQKRSKSKSSLGYDQNTRKIADDGGAQCTEVHFASLLSGGFTTMAVINPPESKIEKRTSVQWFEDAKKTARY